MIETIKNEFIIEGYKNGIAKGKLEEMVNDLLKALRIRFYRVSDEIVNELKGRMDLIALDSLFEFAL